NPTEKSGSIVGTPGETWKAVHLALAQGLRGLPPGSSLAQLLAGMRRRQRTGGSMKDPVIGKRLFTDGVVREVYQAPDGRQYVRDGSALPVFGAWLVVDDEDSPVIAPAQPH